jgi:hypothetical protein
MPMSVARNRHSMQTATEAVGDRLIGRAGGNHLRGIRIFAALLHMVQGRPLLMMFSCSSEHELHGIGGCWTKGCHSTDPPLELH